MELDNEKIELMQGDWLYNAGLVGFINILKSAGDNVTYNRNSFTFTKDALIGFEDKYFDYLIKTYKKSLSWYKIIDFNSFVDYHLQNDLEELNEDGLEVFNNFVGSKAKSGTIKYYLNSNSYIAAYKLIENSEELIQLGNDLKTVKLGKNESVKSKKKVIATELNKLKNIIQILKSEPYKKYIAGKNVIYNIVRQGWDGVSFLNPQTKVPNMYEDYNKTFLQPSMDYFNKDTTKFKYTCFTCDRNVKKLDDAIGFLNQTGFDTARKPSHVWNYNNDVAICPICKLIYSCVPCGITYVLNNGTFINRNHSMELLVEVNQHMKHLILDSDNDEYRSTYRAMISALTTTMNSNIKYELSDIQVVKYEDVGGTNKYRFNIFSSKALKVIATSKKDLEHIMDASFKEVDHYYRLYDEVVKMLFNNEWMYNLINKLLVLKIQNKRDTFYRISHIKSIIRINQRCLKGDDDMEKVNDMLKKYNASGYYLKKAYEEKGSENKLNGVTYRLLNALKTNNTSMFMDTLLNCYLYVNKQVPSFMIECLKDEDTFKSIGYAFIAGLIDGDKIEKVNGGK